MDTVSKLTLHIVNTFNKISPRLAAEIFMFPYMLFPSSASQNLYVDYTDAIHFQRGIHNVRVRNIEVEINVPLINGVLDYALVQRIWWGGMELLDDNL